MCHLIDHEFDFAPLRARFSNNIEGAPAYHPALLIKIVLLAYSRGIIVSGRIEAACRDNVLFIAVGADRQPDKGHKPPRAGTS